VTATADYERSTASFELGRCRCQIISRYKERRWIGRLFQHGLVLLDLL